MKILNFGSLNIDKVYSVSHFVEGGETIKSSNYSEYAGGKGLNQSVAIIQSGIPTYHAGKIGKDGEWLKNYLKNKGINTDFTFENGSITGHAIIQINSSGENCIVAHGGANDEISISEIQSILASFEQNDILVLQGEISTTTRILDLSYHKGMKIVLNPSPVSEIVKNIDFEKIEYLIMNEHEAISIFGYSSIEQTIEKVLEQFPNLKLVITLGSRGSIYADSSVRYIQKAYKVDVVDSTAAGDTFLGFFLGNLLLSNDIKASLEIAAKASAISVTKEGAADSIPSINEVNTQSIWTELGE